MEKTKKKINKTAWFDEGFKILKASGAAGLTIENLTKGLNKTKGSFYHHFKNRDDYSEKLLKFWEEKQTFDIVKISQEKKTFQGVNEKLLELSRKNLDPELEVAIRAWALREPLARVFLERIDNQRMGFLRQMFSLITDDTDKVETISYVRYCFYIGSQQIIPAMGNKKYTTILQTLIDMFETYIKKDKVPETL